MESRVNNYTCRKCGKNIGYGSTHTCVGLYSELEEVANLPWWDGLEKDQYDDKPYWRTKILHQPSRVIFLVIVLTVIAALVIMYLLW
jgi:hypothetical protein